MGRESKDMNGVHTAYMNTTQKTISKFDLTFTSSARISRIRLISRSEYGVVGMIMSRSRRSIGMPGHVVWDRLIRCALMQ